METIAIKEINRIGVILEIIVDTSLYSKGTYLTLFYTPVEFDFIVEITNVAFIIFKEMDYSINSNKFIFTLHKAYNVNNLFSLLLSNNGFEIKDIEMLRVYDEETDLTQFLPE